MEYCELQRWREIVDLYQAMDNVQVLGLIETKNLDGTERTDAQIEEDIAAYTTHKTNVKGFYFNNATGSKTVIDGLIGSKTVITVRKGEDAASSFRSASETDFSIGSSGL